MEAVEQGGHPDASDKSCGDVGLTPGIQNAVQDQLTVEQWQAALQELCKSAQASGQQQAYFANAIGGVQGYGLWSSQPLLAAYGAIPFLNATFPGGYTLPPTSAPPSSPTPKEPEEDDSGVVSSEARAPIKPTKRAKMRCSVRQQEGAKTAWHAADAMRSSLSRTGSGVSKPKAWTPSARIVPGKGGLSIDALAAAARATVRSLGASSPDMWHRSTDCGADLQKAGFLDEKELKRQRRKQSNRESARRSRLRKQVECENLHGQVRELTEENADLRRAVRNLEKLVEQMRQERQAGQTS